MTEMTGSGRPNASPVRVILVEDHAMVREGLARLLADEPDIEVVGEADDGRAGVELAGELRPNIVVMNLSLPGMNGADATRHVRASLPDVRVIALSSDGDARRLADALAAGAAGYVCKTCGFRELAAAVRAVAIGHTYLCPNMARIAVLDYRERVVAIGPRDIGLTLREREVLQLIAEGRSTKEIAAALHISQKTIGTHRHNLRRKLNVATTADLTKIAIREGLVANPGAADR